MAILVGSVTDGSFKRLVTDPDMPVIVDFYDKESQEFSNHPHDLEAAAKTFKGRVRIFRMDVFQSPRTAKQLDVRSTPVLMLFKGGYVYATSIQVLTPAAVMEQFISDGLNLLPD